MLRLFLRCTATSGSAKCDWFMSVDCNLENRTFGNELQGALDDLLSASTVALCKIKSQKQVARSAHFNVGCTIAQVLV
jgi:hypothetical protein